MEIDIEERKKVAAFANALSNPVRVEILYFLANRKDCYFGDIKKDLPLCKATVSQHLKELKKVGLIQGEIEGPKTKYCINIAKWNEARQLFDDFFSGYTGGCSCNCRKGK
ncbi:MAG: winged helix-turn-helix domain-containing protein [Bacteroidales bacterium]|jgi:DNA-binding transcriptional ArsR family regulator|nr:winged helix-turn-helix domain-containing protein [Bacteroidales bacterium]MCI1785779.1 winged helix-turn-helix domain-containing protein [Bacteroidales bacterium]